MTESETRSLTGLLIVFLLLFIVIAGSVIALWYYSESFAVRKAEAEAQRYASLAEYESNLADRIRAEGDLVISKSVAGILEAAMRSVDNQRWLANWYALMMPVVMIVSVVASAGVNLLMDWWRDKRKRNDRVLITRSSDD